LNIEICDLFEIWCLRFGIFKTLYVRKQFPALKREVNGYPVAYLDGPGGYQVPESVIAAVKHYLVNMNANVGHQFETAQNTSDMIQDARGYGADH
jgi:selenocysteine lyase/cysteine desulfurase